MKGYRISLSEVMMDEAIEQYELIPDLNHKERNCLRLLTEEMFSMLQSVVGEQNADFEIYRDGKAFSLTLKVDAVISPDVREKYMSMSRSGENIAYRGLKGKLLQMLEACAESCNAIPVGMDIPCDMGDYTMMWSLSMYAAQSQNEKDSMWDGMERSIIMNFADDVLIGIRNESLEMIVKKEF